jgi:hypothetical protein
MLKGQREPRALFSGVMLIGAVSGAHTAPPDVWNFAPKFMRTLAFQTSKLVITESAFLFLFTLEGFVEPLHSFSTPYAQ